PGDVTLPKGVEGVQVSDISPRDVDIVVDSAARRDVRIAPRVTLEKDSGFALLGITVVPPTARLIGPPKSLAGGESVTTQPTQIARSGRPAAYARLSVQAPTGINARAIPDSVALKRKGGRRG